MNKAIRTTEQRLKLAAGQTFRIWVENGTMLVVTSGTLTLNLPLVSLAETLVASAKRLDAETAHRFERSGWVTLAATTASEGRLLTPSSANQPKNSLTAGFSVSSQ